MQLFKKTRLQKTKPEHTYQQHPSCKKKNKYLLFPATYLSKSICRLSLLDIKMSLSTTYPHEQKNKNQELINNEKKLH